MATNLLSKAHRAIVSYGNQRYKQGLEQGLMELEKVRGWLTRQPDNQQQREVREWVDKVITRFRKGIPFDGLVAD